MDKKHTQILERNKTISRHESTVPLLHYICIGITHSYKSQIFSTTLLRLTMQPQDKRISLRAIQQ